jgi:hypothetical protein
MNRAVPASSDNEHSAIQIARTGGQVGDADPDPFRVVRDGNNYRESSSANPAQEFLAFY